MFSQKKSGAVLSYINIIVKNLVTFMYTPFLLKYIGQSDYGLFQMTNSVITSLSLLSMGFSSSYVHFYIKYKSNNECENLKKLNGMYLILFCLISLIAIVIGSILAFNVDNIFNLKQSQISLMEKLMGIMILNVALTFPSSVFDSNIIVNQRFIYQQGRQLMQTILVPLIAVPMIMLGSGVLAIGITQTIVTTLFLFINANFCIRKLNMKFNFRNGKVMMFKEVLAFSFFIFLNQIVDLINNSGPNFVLGIFEGAEKVAIFAIAIQIKNLFFMLSISLSDVFIPKVNELVSQKKEKKVLTELMIRIGRVQMVILLFVFGGFIVIGQYFIHLWAGDKNILAYWLIILMVLPSIGPLSQNIGIEIQRAMNMHAFRSIVLLIFSVVNIVFTVVGTKYFGLIGASSGYVIGMICANGCLMNWYYQFKMGIDIILYWKRTLSVAIPFLVSTFLTLISQLFVPINSVLVFLFYGVIYVILFLTIYLKFVANSYEKQLIFRKK
ncbi:MAG: hypothetical protein DUD32_10370 [Lactobacillus sp.]|nr:MAG: hypothetical protein DUD32_10370 [Lactobacillus sp.]